eukprot:jgi/Botrbrau1/414/Bobra.110_2s0064.1
MQVDEVKAAQLACYAYDGLGDKRGLGATLGNQGSHRGWLWHMHARGGPCMAFRGHALEPGKAFC